MIGLIICCVDVQRLTFRILIEYSWVIFLDILSTGRLALRRFFLHRNLIRMHSAETAWKGTAHRATLLIFKAALLCSRFKSVVRDSTYPTSSLFVSQLSMTASKYYLSQGTRDQFVTQNTIKGRLFRQKLITSQVHSLKKNYFYQVELYGIKYIS